MKMIKSYFKGFYQKYILSKINEIVANQHDILATQRLTSLSKTYLPWSQSSMRPSGLVTVLNEILIHKRYCIVECGGGISTFYIARLLKERGGHLYTIEHEEFWANFITEKLKEENIDGFASVIFAPLVSTELGLEGNYWYDTEILKEKFFDKKIDMVLVDGPPAYKDNIKYARYPAAPYFHQFMADDYTIILDDANRLGEQEIMKKWESYLNISFERRLLEGNIAIGRAKSLFTV
jgi:hypothetical protein